MQELTKCSLGGVVLNAPMVYAVRSNNAYFGLHTMKGIVNKEQRIRTENKNPHNLHNRINICIKKIIQSYFMFLLEHLIILDLEEYINGLVSIESLNRIRTNQLQSSILLLQSTGECSTVVG